MLLMRSKDVEDPNCWGIPGGAVKGTDGYYDEETAGATSLSDEQLWDTARVETEEEIGLFPSSYEVLDHVVFDASPSDPASFKYHTFVVEVSDGDHDAMANNYRLNWENTDLQWFTASQINRLRNVHKGVRYVLNRVT